MSDSDSNESITEQGFQQPKVSFSAVAKSSNISIKYYGKDNEANHVLELAVMLTKMVHTITFTNEWLKLHY